ncbi:hypothetical protein XA68_10700 [Ophiocordyceps unilateralis]|uniref:NAD-dependent epimerase/dehydratase domain-containing protein n=1 Tax=Ophiocordyceps unilateralis TaxID=268505 RepID=A0A2A9P2C5_OPHUN|nr:hypothetical protein XA68_10700 [Ophiocordyceps unilateralis]
MADAKPSVLIIGGLGYIGRFLALHIHQNKLASDVRLVDKVLPQLAWLAPEFSEPCSRDKFMQADASRPEALARIFDRPDGKQWDYVFNCGGETRYSQDDQVYKLRSLGLSLAVGKEAAKRQVKAFVELSTGMVYKIAVFKLQAEEQLSQMPGLNLIIARLPHVYGPYAAQWVATALCMARVYQHLDDEMSWLWSGDLRTNTVHVCDAVRALWDMASWYAAGKAGWDSAEMGPIPIFNVVDKGETTQRTMADIIGDIFKIETGFQGQIISTFAKLNLDRVVDDVNDETLGPWAELLHEASITRPGPLTPFMEKELLKDTDLSMDGSRLEKLLGFKYEKPKMTKQLIEEVIESYRRMKWWP